MADVEIAQGDFGRESAVVVSLRKASNALYVPELGSTVTITLSRRGDGYAFTEPLTLPTCAGATSRYAFTIEICERP